MASLTYAALREMEPSANAFSKAGTDISVIAVNYLGFSEQGDNAAWTKGAAGTGSVAVVTPNTTANPINGAVTADTVRLNRGAGNTVNDSSTLVQNVAAAGFANGKSFAQQVWVKGTNGQQVGLRGPGLSGYQVITFNGAWQKIPWSEVSANGANAYFEFASRGTITTTNDVTFQFFAAQEEPGTLATTYYATPSAADTGREFSSAGTNISGLLAGEWVLTSGFANAANNGWFQASFSSVAAQLWQDTNPNLVVEAAGQSVVMTGYKRGYGQQYTIDFALEEATFSTRNPKKKHQPIGGGIPETVYWRTEKVITCTTGVIDETDLLQWREFLASVQSGETFTFDRYGTSAAPIEPKQAILDSDDWTEAREGTLYPGRYRISFDVRLVS